MTATDELRHLLDERGVEYETYVEQPTGFEHVKWNFGEHGSADFNLEFGEPWLTMYGVISGPEQAIAATLGRGECHPIISDNLTESEGMGDAWADCSECGHLLFVLTDPNSEVPNYCPNCGAKVVDA